MRTIKLEQAFAWVCPVCDQQNYDDAVPAELTPEEREEADEAFGVERWKGVDGEYLVKPDTVYCELCITYFKTE